VGIIPDSLFKKEVGKREITELHVVGSMHERKALMAELADGFIAMPGGIGTFEEFFEILTWSQLGFHEKPCGLLNVADYYDGLLALCDHAVTEGFLRPIHRALILDDSDTASLLEKMNNFKPPVVEKWIAKDDL
ncbi:MAG TPA: TIGR00730 family Rossman fold protein, partial [Pyrinomonadaceae bacterium]